LRRRAVKTGGQLRHFITPGDQYVAGDASVARRELQRSVTELDELVDEILTLSRLEIRVMHWPAWFFVTERAVRFAPPSG
jgi:signal transduction histidine kinase